ncbi:MAG: signal peptidase I [Deltaproteobacteria bacterium]|nr:signal peptidase I [Deltaproteobacteria bacterium]
MTPEKTPARGRKEKSLARSLAKTIFVVLLFRAFVAEAYHIPSGSMRPTLLEGDRIFVNKAAYGLRLPFSGHRLIDGGPVERGDVAIFISPEDGRMLIKRIVAVAGDRVAIDALGRISIDGRQLPQRRLSRPCPKIFSEARTSCTLYEEQLGQRRYTVARLARSSRAFGPYTVPTGHVFAVGDNRHDSADSRFFGPVPYRHLRGQAMFVYWSQGAGRLRTERMFKKVH